MIKNFLVMSRSQAKRASYKLPDRTIIVSITDPDSAPVIFHRSPNLISYWRVSFDDIDVKTKDYEVLMEKRHAEVIRAFLLSTMDKADTVNFSAMNNRA